MLSVLYPLAQSATDVSGFEASKTVLAIKLKSRTPYENTSHVMDHPPVQEIKFCSKL